MRVILTCLSLAASALALAVTYPGSGQDWAGAGPEEVKWVKTLGSDPLNFTIVLTGPSGLLPNGPQVLTALVPASENSGTTAVRAPSTGWPIGEGFQIQLAKSAAEYTNVLATSEKFDIGVKKTSTSSSISVTATSTSIQVINTLASPSKSATTSTPTDPLGQDKDNSALTARNAQYGLIPLLAMIGFAFA